MRKRKGKLWFHFVTAFVGREQNQFEPIRPKAVVRVVMIHGAAAGACPPGMVVEIGCSKFRRTNQP